MENRVKELRESKGWTQDKLSEMSGITRQTIIAIESNSKEVVMSTTMFKLAKALDTTPDNLFLF